MKVLVHCAFPLIAAAFEALLKGRFADADVVLQSDPDVVARTCADQRPRLVLILASGTATRELDRLVTSVQEVLHEPGLVIITSGFDDPLPPFVGRQSTATLLFDDSIADMQYAIEKVLDGEPVITSKLTVPVMAGATGVVFDSMPAIKALAPRERDVLRLLGDGKTNGEIARELHLGHNTVKSYVSTLLTKLGVRNRVEGALLAKQIELLRVPEAEPGEN